MGNACSQRAGFRLASKPCQTRKSPKSSHDLTWLKTPAKVVVTAGYTSGLLRQMGTTVPVDLTNVSGADNR